MPTRIEEDIETLVQIFLEQSQRSQDETAAAQARHEILMGAVRTEADHLKSIAEQLKQLVQIYRSRQ